MKILAISGSARATSTNTAMLKAVSEIAPPDFQVTVFSEVGRLPVFSPDRENGSLPQSVRGFVDLVRDSDALIIASPEYVRAIPGGLKNAIDWLVSREEIVGKPIALMHASHRGEDMLTQLRLVLSTVSDHFTTEHFLKFELMSSTPEEISQMIHASPTRAKITAFLDGVAAYCKAC